MDGVTSRLYREHPTQWIPAFAGMTRGGWSSPDYPPFGSSSFEPVEKRPSRTRPYRRRQRALTATSSNRCRPKITRAAPQLVAT